VPKRSDERVRRNEPEGPPVEKVTAIGTVVQPPLGFDRPHPLVVDMYHSLGQSAQAKFYEPSDWQVARLAMLAMQQMLTARDKDGKLIAISAMKLQVLNQMFQSLMMTEGDRRRLNLEIERQGDQPGVVVNVADVFRQKLAEQK
jgi:hypothetical protein